MKFPVLRSICVPFVLCWGQETAQGRRNGAADVFVGDRGSDRIFYQGPVRLCQYARAHVDPELRRGQRQHFAHRPAAGLSRQPDPHVEQPAAAGPEGLAPVGGARAGGQPSGRAAAQARGRPRDQVGVRRRGDRAGHGDAHARIQPKARPRVQMDACGHRRCGGRALRPVWRGGAAGGLRQPRDG